MAVNISAMGLTNARWGIVDAEGDILAEGAILITDQIQPFRIEIVNSEQGDIRVWSGVSAKDAASFTWVLDGAKVVKPSDAPALGGQRRDNSPMLGGDRRIETSHIPKCIRCGTFYQLNGNGTVTAQCDCRAGARYEVDPSVL